MGYCDVFIFDFRYIVCLFFFLKGCIALVFTLIALCIMFSIVILRDILIGYIMIMVIIILIRIRFRLVVIITMFVLMLFLYLLSVII